MLQFELLVISNNEKTFISSINYIMWRIVHREKGLLGFRIPIYLIETTEYQTI